jgi:hypothetical protein
VAGLNPTGASNGMMKTLGAFLSSQVEKKKAIYNKEFKRGNTN